MEGPEKVVLDWQGHPDEKARARVHAHLGPHEIGVYDAKDALVRNDEDGVALPLEFVDNGVEALDDVDV